VIEAREKQEKWTLSPVWSSTETEKREQILVGPTTFLFLSLPAKKVAYGTTFSFVSIYTLYFPLKDVVSLLMSIIIINY
jgi:hypothetical protein